MGRLQSWRGTKVNCRKGEGTTHLINTGWTFTLMYCAPHAIAEHLHLSLLLHGMPECPAPLQASHPLTDVRSALWSFELGYLIFHSLHEAAALDRRLLSIAS